MLINLVKPLLSYLFLFFLLANASAQALPDDYIFNTKQLTVKDGLAHQEVYDGCQDARGFIWLGTRSGLCRYNGYSFTTFTKEKNGLSSNSIHAVMEDGDGYLWLFSQQTPSRKTQLLSIDLLPSTGSSAKNFAAAFPQRPFEVSDVQHYFFSRDHAVYFVAKNKLWKYAAGRGFTSIFLPPGFAPEGCSEDNRSIWGTAGNAYTKTDSNGKVQLSLPLANAASYTPLYMGNDFVCVFQTPPARTLLLTGGNAPQPAIPAALLIKEPQVIHYNTGEHTVWIAAFHTLSLVGPSGQIIFSADNNSLPLLDRPVRRIFTDKQHLTWVLTDAGVLLIEIKQRKFKRFLYTPGAEKKDKPFIQCRGMLQLGNHLFAGTYHGSYRIDLLTGTAVSLPLLKENGEHIGDRFTITEGTHENLYWFAKHPIIADPQSGEELSFIRGIKQAAWSCYAGKNNRLYIGTDHGLLLYDKNIADTVVQFNGYNQFSTLRNHQVIGIIKDRKGLLWIITGNGLYMLDEEKGITAHYGTSEKGNASLISDNIQHLYQDADGISWLCTANAGLIRWNRETGEQKQYTREDGLSSNNLYAAYEDKRGNLWISSDYGIMRFNKAGEQVTMYSPEEGITHYEFNRISHYQAKDGRIFFGGLNGITAFYPDDFFDAATRASRVMISSFQQYNGANGNINDLTGRLLLTNKIILAPSDKFFFLSLAVPEYMNTSRTVYQYRVEGMDRQWIKTTSNEIRFGRLPYGNHQLRIRAQMPDGTLTGELLIDIAVKRPWYLQWWFYLLMITVVALAVRLFYHWRIRQLSTRKKELEATVAARTEELQKDKALIEKQAEELLQLDEMKSSFFANVSHELRTPLTLLAGPVNSMLKQTGKEENNFQYLSLMQQNVEQLQRRVNEILDLSKLDAGKLELDETPVKAATLLQQEIAAFESLAQLKNIAFAYHNQLPPEQNLLLDKEQLTKIINNLLSNAVRFTPAGGQIEFILREDKETIQFIVKDTGEGIHPDDQQYIFNRFYQAKKAGTTLSGGTGIGLALTRELVTIMKGTISVQSEPGRGSIFTVALPKKISSNTPAAPAAIIAEENNTAEEVVPAITATGAAQILIVEDNAGLQQFLRMELKDYTTLSAGNGAEALELLQQLEAPPQLIISDIMMPVMDGFTLLEKLKTAEQYQKIPVIMLTARAGIQDKLKALRIGVDDYLVKPFVVDELMARVKNLLQRAALRHHPDWLNAEDTSASATAEEISTKPPSPAWLLQLEETVSGLLDRQEGFTLDTLADLLYISKRQLQRNIKEETGLTPNNYIREMRLHRARLYLESGKYATVAEVSYAVGFNDQHYFSTLYTERFGKKPVDYLS